MLHFMNYLLLLDKLSRHFFFLNSRLHTSYMAQQIGVFFNVSVSRCWQFKYWLFFNSGFFFKRCVFLNGKKKWTFHTLGTRLYVNSARLVCDAENVDQITNYRRKYVRISQFSKIILNNIYFQPKSDGFILYFEFHAVKNEYILKRVFNPRNFVYT